jgi:choline dehydrogenase-like flavoprotein
LSCCDGGNNLFLGSENNVDTATNKSVADVGMISAFQQPTLAAASTTTIRRVNYFTSLIEPLLKQHPELLRNLHFLSQAQVERILIRFSCDDQYGDDDNDSDEQQQQQQCKCKPQAWAVECNIGGNYRRIIRSRREIILCTGAIATPSLLLASGIGMEDDLRKAGIAPWYDEHNIKCCNTSHIDMKQKNCSQHHHHYHHHHTDTLYRNLQVGHNLRDHVLLPRTFVSSRRQCDDISAGAISSSSSSWNSIQGWWMINVPKTNTSTSSIHDDDAKIQLQLADGIQMDYMIPHFAAASLRRRWTILNIDFPLAWIGCIFLGVRAILRVFFGLPVISKWIQQHTTSLNLCLLNPKSVGRVTIVRSSSRALKSSHARLSECNIVIDPNYLSDSEDVENLWRGWNYSSSVKKRQLKSRRCLIEILPGYTLSIGLAICSCISSAMHWLMWALFIVGKPHDEMTSRYGGNVPNWFLTYVAEFSNPYYHWCGSCAMGEEVDSSTNTPSGGSRFVVDENLCVRGLSNLRICDASVFPNSVSGPIALTCAALGHSASSIIIEE